MATTETDTLDDLTLLRPAALAKRWDVTTRTIQRMVASGALPAVVFPGSRSLRIRPQDAAEAIAAARRRPSAPRPA